MALPDDMEFLWTFPDLQGAFDVAAHERRFRRVLTLQGGDVGQREDIDRRTHDRRDC